MLAGFDRFMRLEFTAGPPLTWQLVHQDMIREAGVTHAMKHLLSKAKTGADLGAAILRSIAASREKAEARISCFHPGKTPAKVVALGKHCTQKGEGQMSNVAGKAYGMNVITPMRPWKTWISRFIFMVARTQPQQLGGLLGLSIIHFARWVLIKRKQWPDMGQGRPALRNDYMLFVSNFNGTWDQYIDAFSDGIPNGLDLFWYSSTKYPGSIPITPFKNYIRANQVDTDYYYNATPGAAQRDIKAALRLWGVLDRLAAQHAVMTPGEFAAAYRFALTAVQNDLASPGYAPVASNDTRNADLNREALIKRPAT